MTINHNLKELRKKAGLTQEEVAVMVNVTRQAISSYESGRTRPDLDMLLMLADVYGVDITEILYGQDRFGRKRRIANIVGIVFLTMTFLLLLSELTLEYLSFNKFAVQYGMVTDMAKLETHIRVVEIKGVILVIREFWCIAGSIALAIVYINPKYRPNVKQGVISYTLYLAATVISTLIFIKIDQVLGWGNYMIIALFETEVITILFIYWCFLSMVKWIIERRNRQKNSPGQTTK